MTPDNTPDSMPTEAGSYVIDPDTSAVTLVERGGGTPIVNPAKAKAEEETPAPEAEPEPSRVRRSRTVETPADTGTQS